ncbi:DUF551 domain-containing protein [Sellimonas intestinalis]|uniref:DUF551 domain-containing protein n=1 Tax=Sellimonas intestinalis TaxID=1653434 RepID=UPI0039931504
MQELEKILEEIIEQLKAEGCIIDNDAGHRAVDIIRKHMNDVPEKEDAEICLSKEDFEFLRNHESMTFRCGNEYVTLHKGRSDGEKEMQRDNDSWIPVEERLPERTPDEKIKNSYKKYLVFIDNIDYWDIDIAVYDLWNDKKWRKFSNTYCEIENVTAWCSLPDPYKKIQEENK